MPINWNVVATIVAPIIALLVGAWLNQKLKSKAILISYYGHVSSFQVKPATGNNITINTHSVVLRNAGSSSAINIRMRHKRLPDFTIFPALQHHVEELPNGVKEIVIPILVPGEEITISYLYSAPITFNQINTGIKSDQGFAHQIPVLLQRQYPKYLSIIVAILMLIGLTTTIYIILHILMSIFFK